MAQDRDERITRAELRPLTKREIDQQLQQLAEEVVGRALCGAVDDSADGRTLLPRWIEPAELVRRLGPFIVYN